MRSTSRSPRALGTANDRAPRRRAQPTPLPASQPPRPFSEEEIFERGLDVLWEYALWGLAPAVPDRVAGFPLGTWWDEIKKRWHNGDLDRELMPILANTVSWLAPDLGPAGVKDPPRAPRADQPQPARTARGATLAARHSRNRTLGTVSRRVIATSSTGTVLPIVWRRSTPRSPTPRCHPHADALPHSRPAPLGRVIAAARDDDGEISNWHREPIQHGYIDRLDDDPELLAHWWAGSAPESYMVGYRAGDRVLPLIRRMSLYRFDGDEATVEAIRTEDRMRSPNARLDALAFDIYLLARHRGLEDLQALQLARPGRHNTLADRIAVRDHLIERQMPASRSRRPNRAARSLACVTCSGRYTLSARPEEIAAMLGVPGKHGADGGQRQRRFQRAGARGD